MSTFFRYLLFIPLILVASGSNGAYARADSALTRILERGQLVLGTSGNMPTMSQVDAKGRVTGFDIDMARLMADSMGVKLELRVMPFGALLTALESGEVVVIISNLTINEKVGRFDFRGG